MPLPIIALASTLLAQTQQTPTAYLVGYSHLDTEWCWTYRHSILDCIPKTLDENFALFEKYPGYTFNWTGAKRYGFMKEYYPEKFAQLKEYVRKGRWAVTGSAIDECDANIPAPESIIRQVLYGNRFFKREFGVESNNYLVPDVFGFPASLPSTLAHAGLKGMSTCKLSYYPDTSSPIPFNVGRWVGPDGASIVAALNCQSYHTQVREDLSLGKTLLPRIQDQIAKSGLALDYTYYGQGDEGGSPGEESVKWVEESKKGAGPVRIVTGPADRMFDELTTGQQAALPSYAGELLISKHSAGTATSGATMKRLNHRNELLADAAERAAVAAQLLAGTPYPQSRLTDAWERFLGGQMHDILPGTAIPQAYPFAWNDQFIALNESADVVRSSVGAVAQGMDTRVKGKAILVFNPLAIPRQDVVEADLGGNASSIHIFGPDGREVPSQVENGKLLFLATMPSLGFVTYDMRNSGSAVKAAVSVTPDSLDNARYRVRLDAYGDVASIFDKRGGRELLSAPARLAFLYQKPTRHPAWNMDWDDQKKEPEGYVDGPAKITILEKGPVRVALKIEREAQGSKFASIVRLSAGSDRVEFQQMVDWHSSECSLKQTFPLAAANPKATYDCGIGTVQRGNNWEKLYEGPSQRWFDLTDAAGGFGASVLSEAKYGSDKPDDHTVRLTLLYTPGVRDNYQHQGTADWGRHTINYALTGHAGDWRRGNTPNEAARLVQPLMVFSVASHPGSLGRSLSLAQVSAPGVSVMAMKKAEDSDETIIRVLEHDGKAVSNVRIRFARPVLAARAVDGQEHPLPGAVRVENGAVVIDLKAYAPKALALRFAPSNYRELHSTPVSLPVSDEVARDFDGAGRTLPSDLLPRRLESGGVDFRLTKGVRAQGQKISLPKGRRLYLVAASAAGDRPATFLLDGKPQTLNIQAWDGYIGQCDNRQWQGATEDEKTFGWSHSLLGISPGYIRPAPLAWYADHRRLADGTNDAYRFAYLFRYELPANGAKTLTLPNDPRIVILAATLANKPGDDILPLHPMFDVK